jgi:hypothetical protein
VHLSQVESINNTDDEQEGRLNIKLEDPPVIVKREKLTERCNIVVGTHEKVREDKIKIILSISNGRIERRIIDEEQERLREYMT